MAARLSKRRELALQCIAYATKSRWGSRHWGYYSPEVWRWLIRLTRWQSAKESKARGWRELTPSRWVLPEECKTKLATE